MTIKQNIVQDSDYSALINKYKDLAFNIALKITKNEQDSEEIVQDSFVKAFKGLQKFRSDSRFSTWFYSIVYNTAISSVRKNKPPVVNRIDDLSYPLDESQVESAVNNLNEYDRKRLIGQALSELNELDYTILSLYYYEDLTLKEISRIVGKDRNYLKVLLQIARLKLYKGLGVALRKELKELV